MLGNGRMTESIKLHSTEWIVWEWTSHSGGSDGDIRGQAQFLCAHLYWLLARKIRSDTIFYHRKEPTIQNRMTNWPTHVKPMMSAWHSSLVIQLQLSSNWNAENAITWTLPARPKEPRSAARAKVFLMPPVRRKSGTRKWQTSSTRTANSWFHKNTMKRQESRCCRQKTWSHRVLGNERTLQTLYFFERRPVSTDEACPTNWLNRCAKASETLCPPNP